MCHSCNWKGNYTEKTGPGLLNHSPLPLSSSRLCSQFFLFPGSLLVIWGAPKRKKRKPLILNKRNGRVEYMFSFFKKWKNSMTSLNCPTLSNLTYSTFINASSQLKSLCINLITTNLVGRYYHIKECMLDMKHSRFYLCPFLLLNWIVNTGSVHFSCSVMSDSLRPQGLQHARLPCPSPTPRVYSNSCPSSRWCHPTISSSVIPFSSHLQSFPASGSFQMSRFFALGGQSIGVLSFSISPSNEY